MSDLGSPPPAAPSGLELFEQYDQCVAEFAARQGLQGSAAEELVARVFAHAQQSAVPRPEGSPVGWLRSLALHAHREICAALRGQYSHRQGGAQASPDPEAGGSRRALALSRGALAALPEPLHDAFCLFELEGHSCAEVAALLGISVAQARERLVQGRQQFLLVHYKLSLEGEAGPTPRPEESAGR